MTVVSPERAKHGYLLGEDEGEAHWLLGMLEIVKISGDDTDGEYGLLEVTVRAGEGSPWHVHPDEDEWFYVLEGEFTVYVGERAPVAPGRLVRVRPQGRAAHLHRRDRRSEGADRLPALPLRGLPARGRRAGDRAGAAAAARRLRRTWRGCSRSPRATGWRSSAPPAPRRAGSPSTPSVRAPSLHHRAGA